MSEWASSGAVKIERAKEHINNLMAEVDALMESEPYSITAEDNPETRFRIYRAHVRDKPPIRWGAIAGDAIHNLRSSLDVLWRIVLPDGKNRRRKDGFPVLKSAHEFETRFNGVKEGPRKAPVDILRVLKPYKGGNDLLWMLDVLSNEDKHHVLIPVAHALAGLHTEIFGGPTVMRFDVMKGRPAAIMEDGAEIASVHFQWLTNVHVQPHFTFAVAFGEIDGVECQPIVPTLHQIAGMVDCVVESFAGPGLLT